VVWSPTTPGTYALTALATGNNTAQATSIANTVTVSGGNAPTVTLASPGAAVVSGTATTSTATATAVTGTISGVQLFANGILVGTDMVFPYSATWSPTALGAYALTAIATDTLGNRATSGVVNVAVGANQLPTVTVTAPAGGASVGVGSVNNVTATAADADGTLASVQFFANGVSIGTDTTFPYATTWAPTVAGTYAITALATDNAGASTTSATNVVTVTNGSAPTITVDTPANGSAVAVDST